MKNLIIVESPTKAKTLTKFLPDKYTVISSYGHVRDLPKGELGIDVEKNFEPKYVIPTKARKKVNELKTATKKADGVILATDGDREGEAIAWHLAQALGLGNNQFPISNDQKNPNNKIPNSKTKTKNPQPKTYNLKPIQRIVFHEITKGAVEKALKNPRDINMNLVDAQQARRILDRLVGYKLSPFLWKKIVRGLSAGRVQSVTLRLIVEKEREIEKFKPEEYWSIQAELEKMTNDKTQMSNEAQNPNVKKFTAMLHARDGKTLSKLAIKNEEEAKEILDNLKNATWTVQNIEQKEHKKNPLPPFITSTLQQTAWGRLGYSAKRTMMLAQNLYERGLITYHRTDSFYLSPTALGPAHDYIKKELGEKYLPQKARFYKTKSKGAQEAHEAIRPTNPAHAPEKLKLEGPQKKLYTLIWQRFMASQMESAVFAATTIDISTQTPYVFRATGQVMRFDGFMKIYPTNSKEEELPQVEKDELLDLKKLEKNQHFTKPPARYNEASLVKALEKHGIGRPSTYATIISTIQTRNYVQKNEQRRLEPNEIGFLVNDLLVENFPQIVDIDFTAKMESQLDEVAHGKEKWQELIENFYEPFAKKLEKKYEDVKKINTDVATGKKCPECGKELMEKFGRFGKFLACSGFPDCKHTEPLEKNKPKELGVNCPKCIEGKVIEKRTRRGKNFYGCSRYPDCDFATWYKPHIEEISGSTKKRIAQCPKCKSALVEKNTKKDGEHVACSSKECDYRSN